MNLIIVESPTKAKTLSRFLDKAYKVEATKGHIKDLPKSKLSVDVEHDFKPDYQIVEMRKKDSIRAIKSASTKASGIYLATDPDREGEAIAQHVEEILVDKKKGNKDKIKRISFHEITKEAVEHAIASPGKVNKDLVDAQIARRVLDRLVGYKLSPVLWKKVRRGLSAGRVQSVAVRLVVEREREIEAFKPVEYWEVSAEVKPEKGNKFAISLHKIDGKKAEVGDEKNAKEIEKDLGDSNYRVEDINRREVKRSAKPPYMTSTLTQAAANVMGWSAKRTMSTAQKLYEQGLITYHRTDSLNISKAAIAKVREFIQKEHGADYLPEKPQYYKTRSKSAQEAHEAIRPTSLNGNKDKVDSAAGKLYMMIWRRFVASQMTPAVYDATTIDVAATGKKKYILRATGQIIKFTGWKAVYGGDKTSEDGEAQLPDVAKDEVLQLIKVLTEQKFTKPPARYNEASLIKKLESLGIGRPSTYAPTISTIQSRAYVEKIDRNFHPTPVGTTVNDFLLSNFSDIVDYDFTAEMEGSLDKVADGDLKWQGMMKNFYGPFEKKVKSVEKNAKRVAIPTEKLGKKCPNCPEEGRKGKDQGELVVRTGRFGKFVSCDKFPDCKHTEKYLDKIGIKCPTCEEKGRKGKDQGDVIIKRTGRGRQFFGCSRYPDCKFATWKDPRKTEEKT